MPVPTAVGAVASPAATAEMALLNYLEECWTGDLPLSVDEVRSFLAQAGGEPLAWEVLSVGGLPGLHMACMNEASEADEIIAVIKLLVASGAKPNIKDEDDETALEAVLALSKDTDEQSPGENVEATKLMHVASVLGLLACPELHVGSAEVNDICQWLRRHIPEQAHAQVLEVLTGRAGADLVTRSWSSEELLKYLEAQSYSLKQPISAAKVEELLKAGASPMQQQNGATALLLAVLNPYSTVEELEKVFRLMIAIEPAVVTLKNNGFQLTAINWASDYASVSSQHGLKQANPAALLALMPAIADLCPPEMDAGESCYKVAADGECFAAPRSAPRTRFLEGQLVYCRVEAAGNTTVWEEGVIVGTWYREGCWPTSHHGAPYVIKTVLGSRVWALIDHDRIVRATKRPQPKHNTRAGSAAPAAAGAAEGAAAASVPAAAAAGTRFQRRQAADGSWELLDVRSGKVRPCSPPDSEADSD